MVEENIEDFYIKLTVSEVRYKQATKGYEVAVNNLSKLQAILLIERKHQFKNNNFNPI